MLTKDVWTIVMLRLTNLTDFYNLSLVCTATGNASNVVRSKFADKFMVKSKFGEMWVGPKRTLLHGPYVFHHIIVVFLIVYQRYLTMNMQITFFSIGAPVPDFVVPPKLQLLISTPFKTQEKIVEMWETALDVWNER